MQVNGFDQSFNTSGESNEGRVNVESPATLPVKADQDEATGSDGGGEDEGVEAKEGNQAEEDSDDIEDGVSTAAAGAHRRPGHRKPEPYRIHMRARGRPRTQLRRPHPMFRVSPCLMTFCQALNLTKQNSTIHWGAINKRQLVRNYASSIRGH